MEDFKRIQLVEYNADEVELTPAERDLVESDRLGVNAGVVEPVDLHQFIEAVKQIGMFWAVLNQSPPSVP